VTTTMPQHMRALELANRRRRAIKEFREEVATKGREGALELADVLDGDVTPDVGAMTIDRFLFSVRRVGGVQAAKMIRAAGIDRYHRRGESRRETAIRVRDLTQRERDALSAALRAWGER
jgi:hypothetical protein